MSGTSLEPDAFFTLAKTLFAELLGGERLFAGLDGEASSFVRLNQNRVRQAGRVQRSGLGLTLIVGDRQVEGSCDLSGSPSDDRDRALALLGRLRERIPHVPDDPYLNVSSEPAQSERILPAVLPATAEAVGTLTDLAEGLDLVGVWAAGDIVDGLASSIGHRHWHRSSSFNLDWSCYRDRDKAVKDSFSGFVWDPDELARRLRRQRERLAVMARPEREITPGRYRAFLAPAAVEELIDMLAWGGFGLRDHRTRQSPLRALADGERRLDHRIHLTEEHARGLTPGYTAEGFSKPPRVPLIEAGAFGECLVDARSAREYDARINAGADWPESIDLAAGDLPAERILAELDTGLYISNLWYCNWSDRNACRVTGMTRFASFWVEHGELVAPLAVMRFDDSLYNLFGERLEALTQARELLLSAATYDGRATSSALLPGLLVSGIELAL